MAGSYCIGQHESKFTVSFEKGRCFEDTGSGRFHLDWTVVYLLLTLNVRLLEPIDQKSTVARPPNSGL